MSTYKEGYLQALIDTSWTCYDCGNSYTLDIERCPNTLLDQAYADVRSSEWRRGNGVDND